jgi:hypothetical protein
MENVDGTSNLVALNVEDTICQQGRIWILYSILGVRVHAAFGSRRCCLDKGITTFLGFDNIWFEPTTTKLLDVDVSIAAKTCSRNQRAVVKGFRAYLDLS